MSPRETIAVYTDGSCYPNPGPGGWAFVARLGNQLCKGYGYREATTNNEMELTAIVEALTRIKLTAHPMTLFTDSEYACRSITLWGPLWEKTGWKNSVGQEIKNRPLIEEAMELVAQHKAARPGFSMQYVRGHAGNTFNEMADMLAGDARKYKVSDFVLADLVGKQKGGDQL